MFSEKTGSNMDLPILQIDYGSYNITENLHLRSVFFVHKFPKASEEDTHCSTLLRLRLDSLSIPEFRMNEMGRDESYLYNYEQVTGN
jgi:hypothetical protein